MFFNKNKLNLHFSDNGQGIPNQIKYKIFNENFKYGSTGNTGLGLYIVKQLTSSYGAKIDILDSPSGGADFFLKFRIKNG